MLHSNTGAQNSYIIPFTEVNLWSKERIELFGGLKKVISDTANKEELILVLYSSGSFQLYRQRILASGKVIFPENKWNKLMLSFKGNIIKGFINGKKVRDVNDNKYGKGLVGFGTGWNIGLFDNLEILTTTNNL